ncbi:MAG: prepilin-type N-terminal cleavage/methylation domain-containing protein, partial [Lachnospiraceae bacterium]|nr:prepilin-type N-terminal cleavage/methylation domain-containing protein [Lachnospiraceae bacterium]
MKKKCGKKMNNEGFSLVEVLVAVIILALVAGPVLMAFV